MGITLEQVRRWEPGTMIALGDDITAAGKQYESDVQDALVGVLKTEADWTGPAGEAARSRANRERNAASNAAATMLGLSDALTSGGSQLSAAKNRVLDAVHAATKAGCTVSPDGQISYNHPKTYPTQAAADAADAAAKAKVQKFSTELHEALQHAAQVDANVATEIESQLRKVQDEAQHPDYGSAGASAGAYASIVQSEYAQKQKAEVSYAIKHPGLAHQLLPHLDPAIKHGIGQALADQTTQTLGGQNPNLSNAPELHRLLHAYGHDPQVSSAMFQKLGAAGTVGSLMEIDAAGRMDPALVKLAPDLRTSLAAASNAAGFPAEQFGRNLVKYAGPPGQLSLAQQRAFDAHYPRVAHGTPLIPGEGDGASLLTYLMHDHQMNGNLVLGSANQLDGLERGDPYGVIGWYTNHNDGAFGQGQGPNDMYLTRSTDPMAAIMGNLGAHPKQGYEFFTHRGDGVARQNYYFEQRDWGSDGYAGISSVAEHIGTDPTLVAHDPAQTSSLVSRFMHDVVHNTNFDPQHPGAAASSHIAGLLKFYTPAVDKALHSQSAGDPELVQSIVQVPGFGTINDYPKFQTNDLNSLMAAATGSKAGMQQVAEGIGVYNQIRIDHIAAQLRQHPDDPALRSQLRDTIQDTSALNGYVRHVVGQVQIDGVKNTVAQQQAVTNLIGDAASAVPIPGAGHAVGSAVQFGVQHAVSLGDNAAGHQLTTATANANTRAGLQQNTVKVDAYLSLAHAGLIHPPKHGLGNVQWYNADGQLKTPSQIAAAPNPDDYASATDKGLTDWGVTKSDIETSYKSEFGAYYS